MVKIDICISIKSMEALLPNSRAIKRYNAATNTNKTKYVNQLWTLIKLFPKNFNLDSVYIRESPTQELLDEYIKQTGGQDVRPLLTYENIVSGKITKQRMTSDVYESTNIFKDQHGKIMTIELISYLVRNEYYIDWPALSENPMVTEEVISYLDTCDFKCKWDYPFFAHNPSLSLKFVIRYPNTKATDWYCFHAFDNSSLQLLLDPSIKWSWALVSWNKTIPWSFILANQHLNWDYSNLSYRDDILDVFDWVATSQHLDWNFEEISRNTNISIKTIKAYSNFPWSFNELSHRAYPLDDLQEVIDYIQQHLGQDFILDDPRVTWDMVKDKYAKSKFKNSVCRSIGLTWLDVVNNPHVEWSWGGLSRNKFKHGAC
jgi:hypothetical protein